MPVTLGVSYKHELVKTLDFFKGPDLPFKLYNICSPN